MPYIHGERIRLRAAEKEDSSESVPIKKQGFNTRANFATVSVNMGNTMTSILRVY
ncbi:MAG: hypothetical protein SVP52_00460 [Chloroflexota bacterium]|nr:hypothetical protein [Chloroflexota bacterium]